MPCTLTITKTDVILEAPELADPAITDPLWEKFLAWAADEMSSKLGNQARLDRAGTYLVAHFASLWRKRKATGGAGGATGPLSMVTVGQVSKSFGAVKAWSGGGVAQAVLQTTPYGQEYLRLIRIFMGGSSTVSGGLKSPPLKYP